MIMGRYLMFIAYIGTGFNGMQRQTGRAVKTVASVLEDALLKLCPQYFSFLTPSSRTDKGVHALCNTIHTDLKRREGNKEFDADFLTTSLNETFADFQEDIRILKTLQVNDNFHCRYLVQRRTYVYQVCIARQPTHTFKVPHIPFDLNRCFLIRRPIDMDRVRKAASVINGIHDFKAFTSQSRLWKEELYQRPIDMDRVREAASVINGIHDFKAFTSQSRLVGNPSSTLRNVEVSVEPANGFLPNYSPITSQEFTYWNFIFRSRSFLYKQVRKMSGAMLAAGLGDITIDDVRLLINEPDNAVLRKTNIYNVPPYALYLTDVEYESKDLVRTPMTSLAVES